MNNGQESDGDEWGNSQAAVEVNEPDALGRAERIIEAIRGSVKNPDNQQMLAAVYHDIEHLTQNRVEKLKTLWLIDQRCTNNIDGWGAYLRLQEDLFPASLSLFMASSFDDLSVKDKAQEYANKTLERESSINCVKPKNYLEWIEAR